MLSMRSSARVKAWDAEQRKAKGARREQKAQEEAIKRRMDAKDREAKAKRDREAKPKKVKPTRAVWVKNMGTHGTFGAKIKTARPLISPWPVTTPSPRTSFWSIPKSWQRWVTKRSNSVNDPGSSRC